MPELRASCFLLSAPPNRGTGYLVDGKRIVTCEHVVRPVGLGGRVDVQTKDGHVVAKVIAVDVETDCAVLELTTEIDGALPLPLAPEVEKRVPWEGFGFPALPRPLEPKTTLTTGILFNGVITDVDARDAQEKQRIAVYSDMLAAGLAEPQSGISGGPIAVAGKVVGHFASVLSSASAPGRPVLGLVFAARAADVLALLGGSVRAATQPAVTQAPAFPVPQIAADGYHAFISYRSTDRAFAIALADRLEGFGFRVFVDQRELVPGDRFAKQIGTALDHSANGVLLISRGWIEAPWCQDEANEMIRRSNERGTSFRVIPLLLDGTKPPGLLAGVQNIEFTGVSQPVGEKLNALAWALVGRAPPRDSPQDIVTSTMTDATDAALAELQAVRHDPTRVRNVLTVLSKYGLPRGAATIEAASLLIAAGKFQSALDVLPSDPSNPREKQLRALALSKLKRDDDALDLLQPMFDRAELDSETGGILGGIYRRRWERSDFADRGALLKSYEVYRRTWEQTAHAYPGINVAINGLLLGETSAREVAQRIVGILGAKSESELESWDKASLADALLISGNVEAAKLWYRKYAADNYSRPQDIAVTRKHTRLVAKSLGLAAFLEELNSLLPVPRVVVFAGHMTDAPHRILPRFPEAKVPAVKRRIEEELQRLGGRIEAACSAARGGDLLFAQAVLDRAGSVQIVLPFPESRFIEASVGDGWKERYRRVVESDRTAMNTLLKEVPAQPDEARAYQQANEALVEVGTGMAATFDDSEPTLLTLWDGSQDGSGGTGDMIRTWAAQRSGQHINIDPSAL